MATFTVNVSADVIADDGKLSLREAVRQANATAAADTIVFASALEGRTLTLVQGELTLKQDVSIDGDRDNDGDEVTLSGGGESRIMRVSGSHTDVSLRDLTLTDGFAPGADNGGGILVGGGGLAISGCTLTGNTTYGRTSVGDEQGDGGAIYAEHGSQMTIINSSINDNVAAGRGSGISAIGNVSLIIRGSEFIGNDAAIYGLGGPIALYGGSLELSDSLLIENDGGYAGGALLLNYCSTIIARSTIINNVAEEGGGMSIRGGTTYLSECTIASNGAGSYRNGGIGGGIDAESGVLLIKNSTITGNDALHEFRGGRGGGIYLSSTKLDIISTIVAGNSVAGGAGSLGPDIFGSLVSSNGHNIFGSDVDGAVIGDRQGVAASLLFSSLDPGGGGQANAAGIVPLRSNISNPALSGGDPLAALPTDQVGITRPLPAGSLPDIGAAERNQALSTSPSANNDVLTGTDGANTIAGNAGADLVRGLAGHDTLRGEGGSDVLDGGAGSDLLDGGDGIDLVRIGGSTGVAIDLVTGTAKRGTETDTLASIQGAIGSNADDTFTGDDGPNWFQGGLGRDVATGGAARDLYDFDRVQDSLPGAANRDVIEDLAPQSDRIDLTGIDADATLAGNQAFHFVGIDPFTGPGQLGFRVSGDNVIVRGSTDGDTAPELEIQLTGLTGIGGYVFYL